MATVAKKLTRFLFIATLLIFPLGELGRLQINRTIAITVNDIFVFITCIAWIFFLFISNKEKKLLSLRFSREILFMVVIFFISLVFNVFRYDLEELGISFLYTIRWAMYASLYFIVAGFNASSKKTIKIMLLIVGTLVVVGGFIQYFYYSELRNLFYLGWDEHLYRLFSSFLDPNFAGVFFAMFLIFLRGLYWDKTIDRKITSLLFVCTFIAILLTYSRSALFSLIIVTTLFFWIRRKKMYIFFVIAGIIGITFFLPFAYKTEGTNFFRVASVSARLESLREAFVIFTENPLFGIGFNAYRIAQDERGLLQDTGVSINHAASGTDNSFLFVLATTGLLGITFYVFMWYRILIENLNLFVEKKETQALVVFLSLSALIASSLFINVLFYPFLIEWLWIQIGLTENT